MAIIARTWCRLPVGRTATRSRCLATQQTSDYPNPSEYCANVVRTTDSHFHKCALLMPDRARRCALALTAYSIELAHIRDANTDAQLAQLRMRYWRDCLDMIYEADNEQASVILPGEYPVVRELEQVVRRYELPKHYLEKLLISRERYVGGRVFADMAELHRYCEAAFSPVYYAMLHASGVAKDSCPAAYSAASHAGRLTGLLRFLSATAGIMLNRGRCELPEAELRRHELASQQELRLALKATFQQPNPAGDRLASLVREISETAEAHHQCLREDLLKASNSQELSGDARLCFLPLIGSRTLLRKIHQSNYSLLDLARLHDPHSKLVSPTRLLLCKWLRKIDLNV